MPVELVPSLVIGALILLALAGMAVGWRGRIRRQASLDRLVDSPADLSAPRYAAEAAYVATTLSERPLERVAVAGLGVRGRASIAAHPDGLLIERTGAREIFIPSAHLRSVGLGTFAVDRVVERDGLVVVTWQLGETAVDTYLRPHLPETKSSIVDAIRAILPDSVASKAESSEGTTSADS